MRQPLAERARDSLRLRALDVRDRLRGRSDRLVPPRRLTFGGHADFVETGDALLRQCVDLGGLRPDAAVLDVGSGTGLMARPLAGFLGERGSYDGFDSDRDAVGWCRRRYARLERFRFQVADVYDRRHNPRGTQTAAEVRFPYDDASFDFAIIGSVLTHLLEAEADHYLAETARVLRPGGRVLAGVFVLDEESRPLIAAGTAVLPFLDVEAHVAVLSEDVPEEAVAYDAAWIAERLAAHGLTPGRTRRGTWCGREDAVTFPDVLVAERTGAA
jgi:SAM-dependent methyltransferase